MTDYRDDQDTLANGASAKPGYETAPDHVKRKVNETIDRAASVAARAVGPERAEALREKASVAVDRGEDAYFAALDKLDAQVLKAPYQSLAIALGAGVVLGFLLAGNRRTVIYRSA